MKRQYRWEKVPVIERKPSTADLVCAVAGDVELALEMWRLSNIAVAKRCIEVIPDSQAARRYMLAARRGEIPLCNALLNNLEQS